MRSGRRLAIDVGKARVGLAISDQHAILASPLATIDRNQLGTDFGDLFEAISDPTNLLEIYVGLPLNMKGNSTQSTEDAVEFAKILGDLVSVPVLLVDERLTTAISNRQLQNVSKSQKDARSTIDQMAAVAILEYAFLVERNPGARPGLSLEEWSAAND